MSLSILVLPAALISWVWAFRRASGWRESALRALVLFGAAVALITELLGGFGLLKRGPLTTAWLCFLLAAVLYRAWLVPGSDRQAIDSHTRLLEFLLAACIAAIALIVGWIALLSPPNSADAMAYHMPRVVYWAQSGSVGFFPTPYFNQITLPPLAEYVMLHTYVLSGGDRFINLVQFLGFVGSIVGVSAVAQALGLGARGQAFAAVFCATLPNAILQASGAKNDCLLALWLVAMVFYAVRGCERNRGHSGPDLENPCLTEARTRIPRFFSQLLKGETVFLGLATGLALATKATAYLFAPPLLLAIFLWGWRGKRLARAALCLAGGILLINAPQYLRNLRLSGSILGYDSAQGNGVFRWRNERFGWKPTVSNLLRNTSEQLGARGAGWNRAVYDTVIGAHRLLGIDPQDPNTTWRWAEYAPPRNANHEANANNRWHLLLLCLAVPAAVWLAWKRGDRRWLWYGAGLAGGLLVFCFYLKWQPFLARLELPLFVLGAPLAGLLFERLRFTALQVLLCVFLLNNTRPYLFENWTRPLKGPRSLLTTPRQSNYFADMDQWNNRDSYLEAVELTAQSGCSAVGIDIGQYQLEYPFQALLRERIPSVWFTHVGVDNASARYAPRQPARLCAVLCLGCSGMDNKVARYNHVGQPVRVGGFLLFLASPGTPGARPLRVPVSHRYLGELPAPQRCL
jgi:hypothetical protein